MVQITPKQFEEWLETEIKAHVNGSPVSYGKSCGLNMALEKFRQVKWEDK